MQRPGPTGPIRRFRMIGRAVAFAACVDVLLCVPAALAAAEAHYAGSSARLTGVISIEKRSFAESDETFVILRLRNPVSLLHRSQYPDDAPATETGEVLLRGGFTFSDFTACDAAVTGIVDFRRSADVGLPEVQMLVHRIECRDSGRSSGKLPPDSASASVRLDPFDCEPSPRSSVWITRRWSPYADMDQEMWKAADLLMRDDVVGRWPFDQLRSLTLRLFDARTRLVSAFPEVRAEWEMEYVPRVVEVEFAEDFQAKLDALDVQDERILRPDPVDAGLEAVCEAVCGCTVVLERNAHGRVTLAFSPTTNLIYVIRRLRELPVVRSARLIRSSASMEAGAEHRSVLRVRKLPAAFHFTFEPGEAAAMRRFFVVDDTTVREVTADEARRLLSFDPPQLPSAAWQ